MASDADERRPVARKNSFDFFAFFGLKFERAWASGCGSGRFWRFMSRPWALFRRMGPCQGRPIGDRRTNCLNLHVQLIEHDEIWILTSSPFSAPQAFQNTSAAKLRSRLRSSRRSKSHTVISKGLTVRVCDARICVTMPPAVAGGLSSCSTRTKREFIQCCCFLPFLL